MLEAVIFDFDGLMVETEWSSYEIWAGVFAEHGADLTEEEFLVCIGTRGAIDFGVLLQHKTGQPGPSDAELRSIKQPRQDIAVAQLPLQPGVRTWIDAAQAANIPIAIASSSDTAWIEPHLMRHEIRQCFSAFCTWEGEHVGYPPKPDPQIYLNTIAALGVDPQRTIAFEDSVHGVVAAKAAGLWCVAVPNRLTRALDFSAADAVVASLVEFTMADASALVSR